MKRPKRVAACMAMGMLCLLAAAGLTGYNFWDEHRAAETVEETAAELQAVIPGAAEPLSQELSQAQETLLPQPLSAPQAMMTRRELDSRYYIGLLEVESLGLCLPVQDTWSEAQLKASPCLYQGTVAEGMIIAGHNYRSHFSRLPALPVGEVVRFTDADGAVWNYRVASAEIIAGHDVTAMESGDWDLTLFTCTAGGENRYTLRCTMEQPPVA